MLETVTGNCLSSPVERPASLRSLKFALVRQEWDVHGPWASVRWEDAGADGLFASWPCKASYWEMGCALEADWFTLMGSVLGDYQGELLHYYPGIAEFTAKHCRGVIAPGQLPLEEYDVVISLDPILPSRPPKHVLTAYFMNEHWDRRYRRSLMRPLHHYDLFFDHILTTRARIDGLPQPVSFPYMRAPWVTRRLFDGAADGSAWVDWRMLSLLSGAQSWNAGAEAAARRLCEVLGVPVQCDGNFNRSPYGVSDPPAWRNIETYLRRLKSARYYVSVGRSCGAGQALVEAASLGLVCFGERDKAYHRLLCHPACLCDSLVDLPKRFRAVARSTDMQAEILARQDGNLSLHFVKQPADLLAEAVHRKRRGH